MKIDSNYKPPLIGNPQPPAPKAPAAASVPQSVEVRLSEVAALLVAGDTKAPINRTKIDEIKQAITSGQFKINPEAIADELIDASRQLIESTHRKQ